MSEREDAQIASSAEQASDGDDSGDADADSDASDAALIQGRAAAIERDRQDTTSALASPDVQPSDIIAAQRKLDLGIYQDAGREALEEAIKRAIPTAAENAEAALVAGLTDTNATAEQLLKRMIATSQEHQLLGAPPSERVQGAMRDAGGRVDAATGSDVGSGAAEGLIEQSGSGGGGLREALDGMTGGLGDGSGTGTSGGPGDTSGQGSSPSRLTGEYEPDATSPDDWSSFPGAPTSPPLVNAPGSTVSGTVTSPGGVANELSPGLWGLIWVETSPGQHSGYNPVTGKKEQGAGPDNIADAVPQEEEEKKEEEKKEEEEKEEPAQTEETEEEKKKEEEEKKKEEEEKKKKEEEEKTEEEATGRPTDDDPGVSAPDQFGIAASASPMADLSERMSIRYWDDKQPTNNPAASSDSTASSGGGGSPRPDDGVTDPAQDEVDDAYARDILAGARAATLRTRGGAGPEYGPDGPITVDTSGPPPTNPNSGGLMPTPTASGASSSAAPSARGVAAAAGMTGAASAGAAAGISGPDVGPLGDDSGVTSASGAAAAEMTAQGAGTSIGGASDASSAGGAAGAAGMTSAASASQAGVMAEGALTLAGPDAAAGLAGGSAAISGLGDDPGAAALGGDDGGPLAPDFGAGAEPPGDDSGELPPTPDDG